MKDSIWFTLKKSCLFHFISVLQSVIYPQELIKKIKEVDSGYCITYLFDNKINKNKQQELLKFYLEKNKLLINLTFDNVNKIYEIKIPENDILVETTEYNKRFEILTKLFKGICWGKRNEK